MVEEKESDYIMDLVVILISGWQAGVRTVNGWRKKPRKKQTKKEREKGN